MTEKEIIEFYCDAKNLDFLEVSGLVNYILFAQNDQTKLRRIVGWAAVTSKKHDFGTHEEVMLPWPVVEEGIRAQSMTSVPFHFIVSFKDGIRYWKPEQWDGVEVRYGRLTDQEYAGYHAFVQGTFFTL